MSTSVSQRLFASRLRGGAQWWSTAVRWLAGAVLVSVSLSKFTRHEDLVAAFERYGIPFPDQSVYLAGTIELLGGLLLLIGLLTRLAALAVAGNMFVAVLTGGRIDVDFYHTGLGSLLFLAALFLLWSGPGRVAIDNRWVQQPSSINQ
jgi:putative oxidoreductase